MTCLFAVNLISACARQPYDPFKVPSGEVRGRVRTIALAPLVAPAAAVDRASARALIEPLATQRLQAGGFTVVPSEDVEMYWRRAAGDVGDLYDPLSGKVDETRFETVEAAVYRELRRERGVDAMLYIYVAPVTMPLPGSRLLYCGLTEREPAYWPPSATPLGDDVTIAVVLCLNVELRDLEGRELYGVRHGLEAVETYAEQTRASRPRAERLQQHSRVVDAVEATLGPLANAERPQSAAASP